MESKKLDLYIGAYVSNWEKLRERGMNSMVSKDSSHETRQPTWHESATQDA